MKIKKTKYNINPNKIDIVSNTEIPDVVFYKPELQTDIIIKPNQIQTINIVTEGLSDIESISNQKLDTELNFSVIKPDNNE